MSVFVRFERGRDDVWGPTFGPFEWVQQTYRELRTAPEGAILAVWHSKAGEWFIVDGPHKDEFFSDFIVFDAPPDEDLTEDLKAHDCAASKVTVDGGDQEVRWDEQSGNYVPTGRVWDSSKGAWING